MKKQQHELSPAAVDNNFTIPVVEEQLFITREVIDTGSIRISKKVEEEDVNVPMVSLVNGYTVERKTVDEYVDEPPAAVRYDGRTMIISVLEEEVVVVKRLKLKEEIRLTPYEEEKVRTENVRLKKERIIIQKDPPNNEK